MNGHINEDYYEVTVGIDPKQYDPAHSIEVRRFDRREQAVEFLEGTCGMEKDGKTWRHPALPLIGKIECVEV